VFAETLFGKQDNSAFKRYADQVVASSKNRCTRPRAGCFERWAEKLFAGDAGQNKIINIRPGINRVFMPGFAVFTIKPVNSGL